MAFLTATTGGLKRFCLTINNLLLLRSAALIISPQSCTLIAIGFSQRTCIPLSNAFIDCSACKPFGVQIEIISI